MSNFFTKWIEDYRRKWEFEDDEAYEDDESITGSIPSVLSQPEEGNMEETQQNNGQIIAFMSGKGGVGKTGLALNVANFCAENNAKVLLIDCDLNTNGATTFFHITRTYRQLFQKQKNILTMHEMLSAILDKMELETPESQMDVNLLPVNIKNNFDFIPASIGDNGFSEKVLRVEELPKIEVELMQYFSEWQKQYEVIILDFCVGEGILNTLLSKISNKICIVMTPDALCRQAVRKQLGFVFKGCNLDNIVCCMNMLIPHKRTVNSDALFNEFAGVKTSEDYAKIYKSGHFISISNRELYSCISSIVKNVYEEGGNVLDTYYKTQGDISREIDESSDETIEKETRECFLSLSITLALHFLVFLLGVIVIGELNVWDKILMPACIAIVFFFGVVEIFIINKLHRLWQKLI